VVLDGYVHIRLVDALVPFIGSYHPLALGLGTLAVDLLIAISLTSAFRRHLSFEAWRRVHLLAYVCWPIAFLHGFLIGTDRWQGWMLALDLACCAAVALASAARLLNLRRPAALAPVSPRPSTFTGAHR
jgi:sulfoxide reductase heme-binding subunit YedZ